jgi:hypothetical protein
MKPMNSYERISRDLRIAHRLDRILYWAVPIAFAFLILGAFCGLPPMLKDLWSQVVGP